MSVGDGRLGIASFMTATVVTASSSSVTATAFNGSGSYERMYMLPSSINDTKDGLETDEDAMLMLVHPSNASIILEALLGPRRQELYKVIPITIVYLLIFITGVVGNVCTCLVIARNRYMQTTTNCYLFNLAVSDLLVLLLGLPQETYSFWSAYPWVFGETFCLVRILAAETSTYASILTITAFTAERYVAICHPMRAQTLSGLQRAVRVIALIWLVSGVCSVPMVMQFGVVLQEVGGEALPDSAQCIIRPERYIDHSFQVSTFLFFFTPMTAITVLYVLIGLAVRRSTLARTSSESSLALPARAPSIMTGDEGSSLDKRQLSGMELRVLQQITARRAVLKMLVAVVVVFFLCWAPFHAQRLLVIYVRRDQWTPELLVLQNGLYYVSGVLYYVSSVVNPILYSIMSLKFRQAFRNIFRSHCCSEWSCLRGRRDSYDCQRRLRRGRPVIKKRVKTFRFFVRFPPLPPPSPAAALPPAAAGMIGDAIEDSKLAMSSLQKQLRQQNRFPAFLPTSPQECFVLARSSDSSVTRNPVTANNVRHLANVVARPRSHSGGGGGEGGVMIPVTPISTSHSDDINVPQCYVGTLHVDLQLHATTSNCRPTQRCVTCSSHPQTHKVKSLSHYPNHYFRPYHSYA